MGPDKAALGAGGAGFNASSCCCRVCTIPRGIRGLLGGPFGSGGTKAAGPGRCIGLSIGTGKGSELGVGLGTTEACTHLSAVAVPYLKVMARKKPMHASTDHKSKKNSLMGYSPTLSRNSTSPSEPLQLLPPRARGQTDVRGVPRSRAFNA